MNNDLLRRNFFVATGIAIQQNITLLLTVVCAILAIGIATDVKSDLDRTGFITTGIWCYLAFAAHAAVLKNQNGFAAVSDIKTVFSFIWRTVVVTIVPSTIVAIATLLIITPQSDETIVAYLAVFAVVLIPVLLLAFGLLGTILPAVVVNGDLSFGRALQRGLNTFLFSTSRLIIGPGVTFILMVLTFLVFPYSGDGAVFSEEFGVQPFNLIPRILGTLIGAVDTVMIAIILSRAYVQGEEKLGPTITSDENPPTDDQPIFADSGSWTGS